MNGQTRQKPNIILILADDLGYGDLSSYGQVQWKTPHIDKIGKQGVRLTQFYTPMPYCAPTRASLLTGRYPYKHGLVQNPFPGNEPKSFRTFRGSDSLGLNPKEVLLSELLKEDGYKTHIIGKWHLGHRPEFLPTRHGFDSYLGIPYSNDMRPVKLLNDEKTAEYPVVQQTLTKRYTQNALEFIERNKDNPFFLYFSQAMPHKPLAVSDEFYTPQTPQDLYADFMRELDWSVGEVLKKLNALGIEENTIVIFTSDNGPWFGGSSGNLRGMKATGWEGGIRVPFLIQWKGKLQPGHVSHAPAGIIDVLPTLASLIKLKVPSEIDIDGKDISSLLVSKGPSPHPVLYSFFESKLQTVRSGPWKLHLISAERNPPIPSDSSWVDPVWPDGTTLLAQKEQPRAHQYPGVKTGVPAGEMLLFDLEKDPSEQVNVAAQHPEVVRQLQGLANEWQINQKQKEGLKGN